LTVHIHTGGRVFSAVRVGRLTSLRLSLVNHRPGSLRLTNL